jgi:type II secretory pathway component PulK
VNSTGPSHSERGAALLLALITAALIAAIAASLIVSTSTDLMITGSYRSSAEAMYGVEAGMERAIGELAAVPDWSAVLSAPSTLRLIRRWVGFYSGATAGACLCPR